MCTCRYTHSLTTFCCHEYKTTTLHVNHIVVAAYLTTMVWSWLLLSCVWATRFGCPVHAQSTVHGPCSCYPVKYPLVQRGCMGMRLLCVSSLWHAGAWIREVWLQAGIMHALLMVNISYTQSASKYSTECDILLLWYKLELLLNNINKLQASIHF